MFTRRLNDAFDDFRPVHVSSIVPSTRRTVAKWRIVFSVLPKRINRSSAKSDLTANTLRWYNNLCKCGWCFRRLGAVESVTPLLSPGLNIENSCQGERVRVYFGGKMWFCLRAGVNSRRQWLNASMELVEEAKSHTQKRLLTVLIVS